MRKLQLFIGGEFVEAENGETYFSINPANGEAIAECAWAGAGDAERAIAAARTAFDRGPWRDFSASDRKSVLLKLAALLKDRQNDVALMEVQDAGALIGKATTDVALCVKQLRYFAEMADKFTGEPVPIEGLSRPGRSHYYTVREPFGVCGAIIPWNFPLTMAVWKIASALATGNAIVLKCAAETPLSAMELARLCNEAGVPPGVVNVITGEVEAGQALVKSSSVDKISFTGSTEVGREIMREAAATLKNVTLECGGKSANIVMDDADLETAVDGSLYATFFHSGQVCESGTRLLLSKKLHDSFVERMIARVEAMRIGDPMDPETTVGPVVSERQMDRVLDYIEVGKREGARLSVGGSRATEGPLARGFFVKPTIFTDVSNDMRIAREEIFGPVLCVLRYGDVDEAVGIANDSIFGLAAGVWSKDIPRATDVARKLQAGWVWLNEWHVLSERAPFGGYKQSGIGRELGEEGLNAYTQLKTLYRDDSTGRQAKPWYDILVRQ
ncbi:MAG: aldehyde dehydrogenase family protein [Xanthobacteraceae bacterium]